MTEKLGLDKIGRECRTVDLNQGFSRSQTVIVDRIGDQFLPGPALPQQEDIRITLCHLGNQIKDLLHFSAVADNAGKTVFLAEFPPQPQVLLIEFSFFSVDLLQQGHLLCDQTVDDGQEPDVLLKGFRPLKDTVRTEGPNDPTSIFYGDTDKRNL